MTDLNQYGAACRCLLRLRENKGEPGMSDATFIARFLPRYPEWRERPGATELLTVLELAKELHLAERTDLFRSYARILQEHRAGRDILVFTERTPVQDERSLEEKRHVLVLVAAEEEAFSLWCPYRSGQSDLLPRAARIWWDRWQAIGIVLQPPRPLP